MAKTLVTGATGFVGSHVARALVERGDEVRVALRASSSRAALAGLEVELVTAQLGDRAALRRALRGVERVVHTSSIGAVGPARPQRTADERNTFPSGLGVPYAESKHAAETEALRVAAHGLPVVIVCPAHVFGRGDLGPTSTGVVRRFLLRRIPAFVPGAINIVDVRDVADGHVLADERGVPGERYILGTRNYTWDRLFAELSRISGVERPPLEIGRD